MTTPTESRHHKQLFQIALRSAHSRAALERAIDEHCPHMLPGDHAEARSMLERRASEISQSSTQGAPHEFPR